MRQRFKHREFAPFIWHGFFLALTMSMIDLNTVLPVLLSSLTSSSILVGAVFSLMIGAPLVFNLPFSRFQQKFAKKKKFLLIGIYIRSASFLGLALSVLLWGKEQPSTALLFSSFFILLFSASGGFAGIAYGGLVGSLIPAADRGMMFASRQFFGGFASLLGGLFLIWLFKPDHFAYPNNYALSLSVGALGLLIGSLGFWHIPEAVSEIETGTAPQTDRKGFVAVLKSDPAFLRFILVENLSGFSLMLLPFYMIYVKTNFADYGAWIGLFVLAQTAGSLGSNVIWAWIFRRTGARAVSRACMIGGAVIPVLAILIQPLGIAAYLALFFLIGFVISGRNIGFEPWLLEIAPPGETTLYFGIRGSMSILIAFLPLAGGLFIHAAGFTTAFIAVAVIMTAGSALVPGSVSSKNT